MSGERKYRDEEWLREEYIEHHRSTTDIADECGCHHSTVSTWLKNHAIKVRDQGRSLPDKRLTDADWLREQYVGKKQTASEIAEQCGCSQSAVYGWLEKHGIERRAAKRQLSDKRLADSEWLRTQYTEQNLRCDKIADKCECTPDTVRRWLHRHGIEVRPRGGDSRDRAVDERLTDAEWVREQYVEKEKKCAEIAEEIGCSPSAVQRWVNNHGIETDPHRYERVDERLTDAEWVREQYVGEQRTGYEIAEELDCGFGVVYQWIRKHGIEPEEDRRPSGEDHPLYNGGPQEYGPGWNERKKRQVRDRDDHTCQDPRCSVTQSEHLDEYGERLHVHHLRKARDVDDPEERNAAENLITLCTDCHRRWEKMADAGLVPEVKV